MFSIGEVSEKASVSVHTLRYYEKIGLLPPSRRKAGGQRFYTEEDIKFIRFLRSLKQTGMSLEDITEFVRDGCILEKIDNDDDHLSLSLAMRIKVLSKHLEKIEAQRRELDSVISITKSKLEIYHSLMNGVSQGEK